jgi:hypothetical protein
VKRFSKLPELHNTIHILNYGKSINPEVIKIQQTKEDLKLYREKKVSYIMIRAKTKWQKEKRANYFKKILKSDTLMIRDRPFNF